MTRTFFLFICFLSILSCSKEDQESTITIFPSEPEKIIVTLEEVLSDWDLTINSITCSSVRVDFTLSLVDNSSVLMDYGYTVSNDFLGLVDTVRLNLNSIPGGPFDKIGISESYHGLDPTHVYNITPFIEISDTIIFVTSQEHQIGNYTEIEMMPLLDLSEYDLGFSYISTATSVRIGNKGYLIGGLVGMDTDPVNQLASNIFLEIDLVNGLIKELLPLPSPAFNMRSFVYDGVIYAGGGSDGENNLRNFYRYNINLGWEFVTEFPSVFGFSGGQISRHGDYVYMSSGIQGGFTPESVRAFYRFDPRDNTWVQLEDIPTPGTEGISFVLEDNIYVNQGWGSRLMKYDIESAVWEGISAGKQLRGSVSFVRDGKGFAYSGGYDQLGSSVNVYDPSLNKWEETCIENSEFRIYKGVIFDDGISNPVVGFGTSSKLFTLNLP